MYDALLIVIVLIVGIGGLVGIAYTLDQRGKRLRGDGPKLPKTGPIGRLLPWIAGGIVALTILSLIGAFAFRSLVLVRLTWVGLFVYIINGIIYRIVRRSGL